jgi:hypothetical protein
MTSASALTLGFIGLTATGILSAQTYVPGTAQNGEEVYRACMQSAVERKEMELVRATEEYYRVQLGLMQERASAIVDTWSIADGNDRGDAQREVEEAFRRARSENDRALREAQQDINDADREASRECRSQREALNRQIQDAQREADRVQREQEREARAQNSYIYSSRSSRGFQFSSSSSSSAPAFRYTYPAVNGAPQTGVSVQAGAAATVQTEGGYYYDSSMGNWRVPANDALDRRFSGNTSPFGEMPQGVCGTPWTTPGLGLAGDELPLAACIW